MPKKEINRALLYNPETKSELTRLTEKAEHFDAWEFNPSSLFGARAEKRYLGRRPFSELKDPTSLHLIRMKEIVHLDPALIQVKVLADVLHGAEHNKQWRDWVNVADMDTPKMEVPTITEDDFTVWRGTVGSKKLWSGGKFGKVELDCSGDEGLRTLVIDIKKTWIKDQQFDAVQEATTMAGAAMYKRVATEVCTELAADAYGTESFATALYDTIVNAIATNRAAGFNPDSILIAPAQEGTLMKADKFISVEFLGRIGRLAEEGVIGNFYGTIPVYSTSVCGANPIVFTKQKGEVLGLRQDIQIEEYDDPIQGLEGAVLTMRYDIECAFPKAIRKVATS